MRRIVLDCDPGHDDAIALLLALARDEWRVDGVTVVAGNQTLDKTVRNALTVLTVAGRTDVPVFAGMDRPLVRDLVTAGHVHGASGLDGPVLPDPAVEAQPEHADGHDKWSHNRQARLSRLPTGQPVGPLKHRKQDPSHPEECHCHKRDEKNARPEVRAF